MPYDTLANEPKQVIRFPGWQKSGAEMNFLWFDAPCWQFYDRVESFRYFAC